jgi:hypothetical protein
MYRIKPYTYRKARAMGVEVKPSTQKGKKIDVFKNGKKVASVGAIGYGDYPTFLQEKGRGEALKRQKAYKSRHKKNRTKRGTPGYYADKLLW